MAQKKWIEVTDATNTIYPLAKKVGVNIAFGTDLLMDKDLAAKQGKFLAKLGNWFTGYEALKMATSQNARLLALSGPRSSYQADALCVLKEGAYADLILVDGNPLENLQLVADPDKNFDLIMKDGKVYKNTLQKKRLKRIWNTPKDKEHDDEHCQQDSYCVRTDDTLSLSPALRLTDCLRDG